MQNCKSFMYVILKHAVFAGTAHTSSPGHIHLYPISSSLQIYGVNFYRSHYNTKFEAVGFEPQVYKSNGLVC